MPRHLVQQPLAVVGPHGVNPSLERAAFVVARPCEPAVAPEDGHRRAQHVGQIAALTLRVLPVVKDDVAVAADEPPSRDADVQIKVGRASGPQVEPVYRVDHLPAVHGGSRSPDVVARQKLAVMVPSHRALDRAAAVGGIGPEQADMTVDETAVRVAFERVDPGGERIG